MRDWQGMLPIGVLAALVAGPAFGAAPTSAQIAAAAGQPVLTVLNTAKLSLPETGIEAYGIKAMTADGQIQQLTMDGSGNIVAEGGDALLTAEAQARWQHYGNLKPRLFQELQKRNPTDLVTVDIWAKVQVDYPSRTDLLANSAKRSAFAAQLKQNLSTGVDPVVRWLNAQSSVTLAQAGSNQVSSPLVSATMPVAAAQQLGQLDGIAWVDLDTPMRPASATWYGATNVASARAITVGANVQACVVEVPGIEPTIGNIQYLRFPLGNSFGSGCGGGYFTPHAQYVMGIMSNTYPLNVTSVTDANLFETCVCGNLSDASYGYNYFLDAGFRWCANQPTSVVNFSVG